MLMKRTASLNRRILAFKKTLECVDSQQLNYFIHHYCPCVITQPQNKQDKINHYLLNRI